MQSKCFEETFFVKSVKLILEILNWILEQIRELKLSNKFIKILSHRDGENGPQTYGKNLFSDLLP